MIIHPDWDCRDPQNSPDIALVRLKHPLDLAEHTPPCFHCWKKREFFLGKILKFENKKLARKFGGTLVKTIKFGQKIQK